MSSLLLPVAIVVAAIAAVVPHQAAYSQGICLEGSRLLDREVAISVDRETSDEARYENDYMESMLKKPGVERRRMTAVWPALRDNMYNRPGAKFPFVPQSVADEVKKVCKPGTKVQIKELRYSSGIAAEICDLGKSVIVFGSSVICAVRD
jgi:hypothetical protein